MLQHTTRPLGVLCCNGAQTFLQHGEALFAIKFLTRSVGALLEGTLWEVLDPS